MSVYIPIPVIFSGTAVVATPGTTIIGRFTIDNNLALPKDFTNPPGTIQNTIVDWGDSSPVENLLMTNLTNVPALGPINTFIIRASHTYALSGTYPVTITATYVDNTFVVINSTANISARISSLNAISETFTGIEEVATSNTTIIGSFNTNENAASPILYTSGGGTTVVNWGDDTPSEVLTAANYSYQTIHNPITTFVIVGSHTYVRKGDYTVSIKVTSSNGTSIVIQSLAIINNVQLNNNFAPPLVANPTLTNAIVAQFTTPNSNANFRDFNVLIDWGDGSPTSLGDIIPVNLIPVTFNVTGNHIYTQSGIFNIKVAIRDNCNDLNTFNTVTVTGILSPVFPVPLLNNLIIPLNTVIRSFTDSDLTSIPGNFTALIDWDDGTTSAGTITQLGGIGAQFNVEGGHIYPILPPNGIYNIQVFVTKTTTGATITLPNKVVIITGLSGLDIQTFSMFGKVKKSLRFIATFTDESNPMLPASSYSATIDWGDHKSSTGIITQFGTTSQYEITAKHKYKCQGNYNLILRVNHNPSSIGNQGVPSISQITIREHHEHNHHHDCDHDSFC